MRCLGLVSGVADVGALVRLLAGTVPRVTMPLFRRMFSDPRRATRSLRRASRRWIPADRAALAEDGVQELMTASLVESFRSGARGPAQDAAVLSQRCGFALDEITVAVHLWHGTDDHQVRVDKAQARRPPYRAAGPVLYPEEGHVSVIANHADEIVQALAR